MNEMTATLISGRELSQSIRAELRDQVLQLEKHHQLVPGLAVILVGEDPASKVYVGNKEKACQALGIYSEVYRLADTTSEQELLTLIHTLNAKDDIHGILVQMPLPPHISEEKVIFAIHPNKDVDGFHPINVG